MLRGPHRRPSGNHARGFRHRCAHKTAIVLCEHRHDAASQCRSCLAAVRAAMIRRERHVRRDGLLERAYVLACRDGLLDEAATILRDIIVAAEVSP